MSVSCDTRNWQGFSAKSLKDPDQLPALVSRRHSELRVSMSRTLGDVQCTGVKLAGASDPNFVRIVTWDRGFVVEEKGEASSWGEQQN